MTDKQEMACEILCALLRAQPGLVEAPIGAVELAWQMVSHLERLGEKEEEDEERQCYREDISED